MTTNVLEKPAVWDLPLVVAQETSAQPAYLLPGATSRGYVWGPAGGSPALPLEHAGEGHEGQR